MKKNIMFSGWPYWLLWFILIGFSWFSYKQVLEKAKNDKQDLTEMAIDRLSFIRGYRMEPKEKESLFIQEIKWLLDMKKREHEIDDLPKSEATVRQIILLYQVNGDDVTNEKIVNMASYLGAAFFEDVLDNNNVYNSFDKYFWNLIFVLFLYQGCISLIKFVLEIKQLKDIENMVEGFSNSVDLSFITGFSAMFVDENVPGSYFILICYSFHILLFGSSMCVLRDSDLANRNVKVYVLSGMYILSQLANVWIGMIGKKDIGIFIAILVLIVVSFALGYFLKNFEGYKFVSSLELEKTKNLNGK